MQLGPRVSVVIPAYNAQATIAATLRAVLSQSLLPGEIVVVDDGSTDATCKIVAGFAAGNARVRLLQQERRGPMVARNVGIATTTGAYVAPVDADDIWHTEYLADLAGALELQPDAGFAYALYRAIDAEDRVLWDGIDWGLAGPGFHAHLLLNCVGNGSSALFRREALVDAGGYDERSFSWGGGEDYLLQLRISTRSSVARVGRYLVGYRRTGGSYSSNPLVARDARLQVVRTMMSETGVRHGSLARWVRADAELLCGKALWKRGARGAALVRSAFAALLDPSAVASILLQRHQEQLGRTAGSVPGRPFGLCDPDIRISATQPSRLAVGRLNRLGSEGAGRHSPA